jgi:cobalt-zinc-cadmium resistance protein CzcA
LTIVFALASSLLLSLTVIPVLSSFLLKKVRHEEPWLPRKLEAFYVPKLRWCLDHAGWVIAGAAGAFVATMIVYLFIGKSFMPTMDEGDIIVQLEKLPSITLQDSVGLDLRVERAILDRVPEVTRIVARVGSDEIGMDPMGLNETDIFMVLKPKSEWRMRSKEELIDAIRIVLEEFPGIAYGFTQPIEMRVSEMLTGVRGDVAVKLFGPDLDELNRYAGEIAVELRTVDGSQDVFTSQNEGMQYFELEADRLTSGRLGLSVEDLQGILRAQLEGLPIGIVQEGAMRTPLIMRADASIGASPASFAALPISLSRGEQVPLGTLATIRRVEGVVGVARQRFSVVRTNVAGRDLVGFVEDAREQVASNIDLPPGYYVEWGGQFENQQRAAARLAIVVPASIALIFLLLFSTFRSVRQALLVLTNVPLALIGGVLGLWITGEYLSVPASVGFIALLGIAVLNGVVLVTYFNQLRARGMPMTELVIEGARRRLRPVLMTASIAAFGLVPLLFATGPGSEIQRPLAIVVIGGLITATMLTLVILPILYRRFESAEVSS